MNQESVAALMRAAAPVIAGFVAQEVAKATGPLLDRIKELEQRPAPEKGEPGERGERGEPGKSLTVDDVLPLIVACADEAIKTIEIPRGEKGDRGDDGKPGEGVTKYEVELLVAAEVAEALADLPKPEAQVLDHALALRVLEGHFDLHPPPAGKDGRDGVDGKDGAPGADGKDGVGLADAVIDRDGNLVLTMTDGRTKALGLVVGKDGEPGHPGKDGRDGFSPEDFTAELKDDGRTVVVKLVHGEHEKSSELVFPVVLYQGVWREGPFKKGDAVTWGGSVFIAQCDTEAKPEQSKDWRLAVKHGRDGKDGKPGEIGKQGPQGLPGKDWLGNRG